MSSDPTKGGKGKKAPYGETQHYRIPIAIRQAVEDLSSAFKYMCAYGRDTDELLREVRAKIADIYKPDDDKVVPAKTQDKSALEVDKLKTEIDILKQTIANKQQEIELLKNFTRRPDLSDLHVYQPNRKGGLYSVEAVKELLDKHYTSGT